MNAHVVRSLSRSMPAPIARLPPPPLLPPPPALLPYTHYPGTNAAAQPSPRVPRHRQSADLAKTALPAGVTPSARAAARSRFDRDGSELPSTMATDWKVANQYGTNVGEPRIMDLLADSQVSHCSIALRLVIVKTDSIGRR